jgi:VWFA-related protein
LLVPDLPPVGEGANAFGISIHVNFVEIPFTVRDGQGKLMSGLSYSDVRVTENGQPQQLALFTSDPFPLSVAVVIDASLPVDTKRRVNESLGALQAAFARSDEMAVFTFGNEPHQITDFSGAQTARITQALDDARSPGRQAAYVTGGPLGCTTCVNGANVDPNTAGVRYQTGVAIYPERELHTLNDAILEAAIALSKTAPGRRRIVYVISDGKEHGSTTAYKEVAQYLQTHHVAVYGTLVGDSALPVLGFLDGVHLPLTMRDNILNAYAAATGGRFDAEFRTPDIEKSFTRISEELRSQYTLGYYTREPFLDGKYRELTVTVQNHGPDLNVLAKKGYWP